MKLSKTGAVLYGTPWAIEERAFQFVADVYESHLAGADPRQVESKDGASPLVRDGVGIIPIMGPIMPRANLFTNISGATSSEQIAKLAAEYGQREDVKSVLLRIDSPGGSVMGGFEAADALFQLRQKKPMIAMIENVGASLAYLFASQAEEIYATRASVVGSIGVIARMPMTDRMERNAGVDVITVASSREKAMSGLSEGEIRRKLESEVAQYFSMFKDAIARGRDVDMAAIATGETWLAPEAVELGAIDGIASLEEILATMKKTV